MSENGENDSRNPKRNQPPERFQPKVLVVWLVIFATIIGLWSLTAPTATNQQHWSVTKVLEAARKDQIKRLDLKPEPASGPEYYRITGELKANKVVSSTEAFSSTSSSTSSTSSSSQASAREKIEQGLYFSALGRLTEDAHKELTELASQHNVRLKEEPSSTLLRDLLLGLLPFLLIIGLLYFLFVRQLRQAGRGAMNFGKSKARMLTRDKERVTFVDVAGCDEAKEDVKEIIDFLKDPKKFQRIGGRVPKGVLMVGPPGTGKTLLAKAVAGEADVPFFSISGSDFVEMFVGVGAARVRDMFEQGRKNAPCLIFIDEIDAVGRQRGAGLGGGNDEREQTLNSLLVEMDGFDSHEGVIIIAATNRPDVLDNALLRPGRFDRQVMIDLPDLHGRHDILKVHAKKIKLDETVDLEVIARNTPGFSGADLANLLNEAALLAARMDRTKVRMVEVNEARDKIAFGAERRKLMDDEDKKMTAWHEAGHALVQMIIKDKHHDLHKVTIIPRGRALGMAMYMPKKDILGQSKEDCENMICICMAGRIGEEKFTGDISNGAASDIKRATQVARSMVCDWGMSDLGPVALGENQDQIFLGKEITRNQNYSEETSKRIDAAIRQIVDAQFERAERVINEHQDALRKIAEALLEYETLDGKHVQEIIEHGELKSPVITIRSTDKDESKEEEQLPKQDDDKGKEDIGPAGGTPSPTPA